MADDKEDVPESPDVYFEPLVNLPPVVTKTLEENEEELVRLRAKLYRYDKDSNPPEWKERGVGDVKILRNTKGRTKNICRVVMRRDKTLKVCLNHYVLPQMDLMPNCGSDKAWVWSTLADYADEKPKRELLAIRFTNVENAQNFKETFSMAKEYAKQRQRQYRLEGGDSPENADDTDSAISVGTDFTDKLEALSVNEHPQNCENSDDKSESASSNNVDSPEAKKDIEETEETTEKDQTDR